MFTVIEVGQGMFNRSETCPSGATPEHPGIRCRSGYVVVSRWWVSEALRKAIGPAVAIVPAGEYRKFR